MNYQRFVDMMREEQDRERKRCLSSIILSKLSMDNERLPDDCAYRIAKMFDGQLSEYTAKNLVQSLRYTETPQFGVRMLSRIEHENRRYGPMVVSSIFYIDENYEGAAEYTHSFASDLMTDPSSMMKDATLLADMMLAHSADGNIDIHCDIALYASLDFRCMPTATRSLIALSAHTETATEKLGHIWANCKSVDASKGSDEQVRRFVIVFALTECNYNLSGLLMDMLDYYLDTNYEPAKEGQEDIVRTILNSLKSVKVLSLEDISAIHAVIEMSSNMAVWTAALEVIRVHSPSTLHLVDINEEWKLGTVLEQYLLTEEGTEIDVVALFAHLKRNKQIGIRARIFNCIAHSGVSLDGFQVNNVIASCDTMPSSPLPCLVNTINKDGVQYLSDCLLRKGHVLDVAIDCLYQHVETMGFEADVNIISEAMRGAAGRNWFSSTKIDEISSLMVTNTYSFNEIMFKFRASLFDISISPQRVGFMSAMIAVHRPEWVSELVSIIPEQNRIPFINSLCHLSSLDDGVVQAMIWMHSKGYGLPFLYHSMAEAHSVNGLSGGGMFDGVKGDGSQGKPFSVSGNKMIEAFLYNQLGKYENMSEAEFMAVTTALQSVDVGHMLRFVNSNYEALSEEKKNAIISAVSYGLVLKAVNKISNICNSPDICK